MKLIVLGLLCLLAVANTENAENDVKPGSKIFTRGHTLAVLKDKLLPLIPTILKNITLNTTTFTIPVKDWMNIDVSLTPTIQVVEIKPENTNITFSTQSLNLSSAGVGFNVTAKLYVNSTLFDSNGSIVINGSNNKVELAFNFVDGPQKVIVNTTSIDLSNVDLNITGDLIEDIIQMVWVSFKAQIVAGLNTQISAAMKDGLQDAINKALSTMNGTFNVPNLPLGFVYNLTQIPSIDVNHLELWVDNTFYNNEKPFTRPPIDPPVDLPLFDPATQYDIQIFMSQYAVNSAFYALWDAKVLTGYLNSSVAPQYLTVSSFAALIPQLLTAYAPDKLVDLNVTVTNAAPAVIMSKTKSNMTLRVNAASIDLLVHNSTTDNSTSKALTMDVSIDFSITVFVTKNNSIQAKILGEKVTNVTVRDSVVGPIDGKDLRAVLDLALKVILPSIQKILEQYTLPLPVIMGIKLVDPDISFYDGYIGIQSAVSANEEYWEQLFARLVYDMIEERPQPRPEESRLVKSLLRRN